MSFLREPSSVRPLSRSHSRASSRDSGTLSVRGASPTHSLDDNVSTRQQISVLQHTVRHQKAQLQHLESLLQRSPRPTSSILEKPQIDATSTHACFRLQRSSSVDQLQFQSVPEAIPLSPKRGACIAAQDEIKEGVPVLSNSLGRRSSSPMRTLSRIPVASVGNARTLAEEGTASSPKSPSSGGKALQVHAPIASSALAIPFQSTQTSSRRVSYGGGVGNTTKVLADLQTGVTNAKNALENTKAQLRLSQRTVAQLTRQTEDLKDGKERLRLENEGLSNVVARKERLLQEVLERARRAEAEAASLKAELRVETTNSRRAIREMEAQVQQSTTISHKSEREYAVLRDSFKGLQDSWARQLRTLEQAIREKEARFRVEVHDLNRTYSRLFEEIEKERTVRNSSDKLVQEVRVLHQKWGQTIQGQVDECRVVLQRHATETNAANKMAHDVSDQLSRLRGLIRAIGESQEEPA